MYSSASLHHLEESGGSANEILRFSQQQQKLDALLCSAEVSLLLGLKIFVAREFSRIFGILQEQQEFICIDIVTVTYLSCCVVCTCRVHSRMGTIRDYFVLSCLISNCRGLMLVELFLLSSQ